MKIWFLSHCRSTSIAQKTHKFARMPTNFKVLNSTNNNVLSNGIFRNNMNSFALMTLIHTKQFYNKISLQKPDVTLATDSVTRSMPAREVQVKLRFPAPPTSWCDPAGNQKTKPSDKRVSTNLFLIIFFLFTKLC